MLSSATTGLPASTAALPRGRYPDTASGSLSRILLYHLFYSLFAHGGVDGNRPLMATRPAPSAKSRMALSERPLRGGVQDARWASPAPVALTILSNARLRRWMLPPGPLIDAVGPEAHEHAPHARSEHPAAGFLEIRIVGDGHACQESPFPGGWA